MKKIFTLIGAVFLLFSGVQNVGAWGFKEYGWNNSALNSFTNVPSFYIDGYNTTTNLDIFIHEGTLSTNGSGVAGFNIYQNVDSPDGYGYGTPSGSYLWCDYTASSNSIIRATAQWDEIANAMRCNYTVILPNGKVYANGMEMMRYGSGYNYQIVIPKPTTVNITGDIPSGASWEGNGLASGGSPSSLTLNISGVIVNNSTDFVCVQYNLLTNQVQIKDVVLYGFKQYGWTSTNTDFTNVTFATDGNTSTTSMNVYINEGVLSPNGSSVGFNIYKDVIDVNAGWGTGVGGIDFYCDYTANSNTIIRACVQYDGAFKCNNTVILPDGKVFANDIQLERVGATFLFTKIIPTQSTVAISGSIVSGAVPNGNGLLTGNYPANSNALQLNIPAITVPSTISSPLLRVTYNLQTNKVDIESVPSVNLTSALGQWKLMSLPYTGVTFRDLTFDASPQVAIAQLTTDPTTGVAWHYYSDSELDSPIGIGTGFAYLVNPNSPNGFDNPNWNNGIVALAGAVNEDEILDIQTDGKYFVAGNPFSEAIIFGNRFSGDIKIGCITLEDGTYNVFNAQDETYEVEPYQGVIVESADGNAASFSISNADNLSMPAFAPSNAQNGKIIIETTNSAGSHSTKINNNAHGSNIVGNYDMSFLNMGVNQVVQLYSSKQNSSGVDVKLGLNTVNTDNATIPVSIFTNYSGDVTVTLTGMDTYQYNVTLVDNLTGENYNITDMTSYSFETTVAGSQSARFSVVLAPRVITGDLQQQVKVAVWVSDGHINILSDKNIENIAVYSVDGRKVYSGGAQNSKTATISTDGFACGIYIVKANGKTEKVEVK